MSIQTEGFYAANPILKVAMETLGATQHYVARQQKANAPQNDEVANVRDLAATIVSTFLQGGSGPGHAQQDGASFYGPSSDDDSHATQDDIASYQQSWRRTVSPTKHLPQSS